jgi:hypothetical protein
MNLYTFIFEFKGGTYISQFSGENEATALKKWVNHPRQEMLASIGFAAKKAAWISKVSEELKEDGYVKLKRTKSAWYAHILIGRSAGHLNFVNTKYVKPITHRRIGITNRSSRKTTKPE